jgi:hypothetical protein
VKAARFAEERLALPGFPDFGFNRTELQKQSNGKSAQLANKTQRKVK